MTTRLQPALLLVLWGSLSLMELQAQRDVGSAARPDFLLVASFDNGVQNAVGGYHNKLERAPTVSVTARVADVVRGRSGRSLKVSVDRKAGGFGGVWITFYNLKQKESPYLDVRDYAYLSFWVRGARGGEQLTVKLADASWVPRDDALPVGPLSLFLPKGVTTEWQEVLVPLSGVKLNLEAMAGLTLDFDVVGRHTVYVDDVGFKQTASVVTPLTQHIDEPVRKREYDRAMWDWNILSHISDASRMTDFLTFCKTENIKTLWMQVSLENSALLPEGVRGAVKEVTGALRNKAEWKSFIAAAHRVGVRVEALDGFPEYAVKQNHNIPLAVVDAVIDYNGESRPEERFDGIHLDNEPYLLIGWRDWTIREQILRDFLELNQEAQRRVRQHSHMVYGVDIPFWWQHRDQQTGEFNGVVDYNGSRQPASFHLIDMLDNVGVMNYRNTVDGADGMLEHGQDLLQYADKRKRAKLFMGMETSSFPPATVWFVAGLPRKEFEERLKGEAADLAFRSRVNGFRTQIFDDGTNLHVGIELPPTPTPEEQTKIGATMAEIAEKLGASGHPAVKSRAWDVLNYVLPRIASDPEWKSPRARSITNPADRSQHAGFEAVSIMLPKITFAGTSHPELRAEMKMAEEEFSRYQSYAGLAIHYYETYRAKVEE
ncbi:MAG TPA: hypothetical protein VNJ03_18045, partial [Vicinamibacterales bacterium]|nr:hypothetical protein [Vicinamibacterales bacterium]